MKKIILIAVSFFYVSWTVTLDSTKDYCGAKEDSYGVRISTTALPVHGSSEGHYFYTTSNCPPYYKRHTVIDGALKLKSFLRNAPQEVSEVNYIYLDSEAK